MAKNDDTKTLAEETAAEMLMLCKELTKKVRERMASSGEIENICKLYETATRK